jgi:hypothetical protein
MKIFKNIKKVKFIQVIKIMRSIQILSKIKKIKQIIQICSKICTKNNFLKKKKKLSQIKMRHKILIINQ